MYQTENYTNPIKHEVPLPTEAGLFCENDKTRTMKRIAIQGIKGSYHDMAAHYFFHNEDIELICCSTFEEVFATVKDDSTILGMAAIENTIAGSLLHNYELLCDSGLTIVGEHKLRISHSLLCLPDDNLEDITEVHSHPVALMQCREFLARHPRLKVVEGEDTAGSAEIISREQLRGQAAICSKFAAPLYGMKVLEEGIETNKHNFTRFLTLSHGGVPDRFIDKASIVFTLPHTSGSLSKILSVFTFYDINLSKIQSLPLIGREWEYRFYVDLTFDSVNRYRQALNAATPLMGEFRILGEYSENKSSAS